MACIPAQFRNILKETPLYKIGNLFTVNEKTNYSNKFFLFQLAKEGIERDVYKTLIAPYANDLPDSHLNGFRRVCADHNFVFISDNIVYNELARSMSCQVVPLPDTLYREPWAYIISKNSPYKGLINWR